MTVPTIAHQPEAALRWRSQFASKPALCFSGFQRVSQIGDNLMDVIALWALKGVDICPNGRA